MVDLANILRPIASAHISLCGSPRGATAIVDATGKVLATWGLDASPFTVFRIASMTKSFTAAAVLALRDRGTVNLDAPIATIDAALRSIVGPGVDPTPITLRHLLTMSSGLATDDPWADRHLDATDADLDSWIAGGLRFAYPTGTKFEYSNLGYALIGRVIHRATGKRLQDHVRELFLEPLAMAHTAWSLDDLPTDSDVSLGMHEVDGTLIPEPPLNDGVVAPMGGLWSCTADLCRWIAFLSSAFTSDPIAGALSPSSRREMQQLQRGIKVRRSEANDGSQRLSEGGYAMGLTTFLDDRFGWIVTHSGGLPGFGSNMRWAPGGVGVVSLANITYAPMWDASAAVLDALGHAGLIAPVTPSVKESLTIAAGRLAALFAHWDDALISTTFTDNVLLDVTASIRQREIFERFGSPEALDVAALEPANATAGIVTLVAAGHLQRLSIQLAPIGDALIQKYEWVSPSNNMYAYVDGCEPKSNIVTAEEVAPIDR